MRIGFDAKRLFNNFTGLGNYSRFMVSALQQFFPDNEYFLYTPKIKTHPDTTSFLGANNLETKQPSSFVKNAGLGSLWRSVFLSQIAARDHVQLFHGLSNELPISNTPRLKKIVTVHDLIFKRYPAFYNPIDVSIYSMKLKRACRLADKIVAISQQTADDLVSYLNVKPERISVVYQGCHSNFKIRNSERELTEIKKKYGLPNAFILNVGTIEYRKNAKLIVDALAKMKSDLPLVIVGRATPYLSEVQALIRKHQLEKRVVFIHKVEFADLPMIYQSASVFVYPSLFEGFGIPIVEAISCGIPVISSQGSCFSEAGGPDSIYIDPKDSEALAVAIDNVLGDPQKKGTMVENSSVYIQKFEPEPIAKKMMGIYTELV